MLGVGHTPVADRAGEAGLEGVPGRVLGVHLTTGGAAALGRIPGFCTDVVLLARDQISGLSDIENLAVSCYNHVDPGSEGDVVSQCEAGRG